jgi:hypothetical protein
MDTEIRDRVLDVLDGSISIDAFEEWFVGATWDHRSRLAAEVDRLLIERDLVTDEQLRHELADLVATVYESWPEEGVTVRSVSNSTTVHLGDVSTGLTTTIREHLEFAGR